MKCKLFLREGIKGRAGRECRKDMEEVVMRNLRGFAAVSLHRGHPGS